MGRGRPCRRGTRFTQLQSRWSQPACRALRGARPRSCLSRGGRRRDHAPALPDYRRQRGGASAESSGGCRPRRDSSPRRPGSGLLRRAYTARPATGEAGARAEMGDGHADRADEGVEVAEVAAVALHRFRSLLSSRPREPAGLLLESPAHRLAAVHAPCTSHRGRARQSIGPRDGGVAGDGLPVTARRSPLPPRDR